jgi:hypothetical protein
MREILRIFEVTDAMGISREALMIPLAPRHPGRIRKMPNGRIEIVVDAQADFDVWVGQLETEIRRVLG